MNNKVQQRFDASIREALKVKPVAKRRQLRTSADVSTRKPRQPKGLLYLDPDTGGTVFAPEGTEAYAKRVAYLREHKP